ncbi:helix-hairpin-helix domain-containing protein [Massilia arenosa]|uniref:Helix-hairpin-helix domain-containing protein n=1 Tax=Zemynaea arenosa TaxID=2561931 RepID=A0A4Y9SDL6_9BURK|nr:helix-hairpin-helix domain-containing protein [Massilia arenosa]TFW18916.1 helix-hairpin-helix domain-containing protein [Massilia arenosa]
MLKKFLLALAALAMSINFAWAQVDVNKADAAALDAVKGIGPAKSKAIIEERNKNGDYKDWADLQKRVKGMGAKASAKLSEAGLMVNGKGYEGADMASAGKPAKTAKSAKAASADMKPAEAAK